MDDKDAKLPNPVLGQGDAPPTGYLLGLKKMADQQSTTVADSSDHTAQTSRSRHASGSNPNVRGIILDSPTHSTGSAFSSSPVPSPSPFGHQKFELPPGGGGVLNPRLAAGTRRIPSSSSDYSVTSYPGGARPKTANTPTTSKQNSGSMSSEEDVNTRRFSGTYLRRRRSDESLSRSRPQHGLPGRAPRDVVEQSQDVMLSFMYERYNRDIMSPAEGQRHLEVLQSPEALEEFSCNRTSNANLARVGIQLAAIGDEMQIKYGPEFKAMTNLLNIRQGAKEIAYQSFMSVCRKLFEDGQVGWGRIVALLQFGYHLAMDVLTNGIGDFMRQIIRSLIFFIAQERISETIQSISHWIAGEGGWVATLQEGWSSAAGILSTVDYRYVAAGVTAVAAIRADPEDQPCSSCAIRVPMTDT